MAGTGDYQEEVLSGLLELQAELRGESRDAPTGADGAGPPDAIEPRGGLPSEAEPADAEAVTVATSGLQVTVTPSSAAVVDRLTALNARLSQLEERLTSVTQRIDGTDAEVPAPSERPADGEASWKAFLDLQRIVADRLDHR